MATITLEIPDELVEQAEIFQAQLDALVRQRVDPIAVVNEAFEPEVQQIVAVLANQPTPQAILDIQPSPRLQARVSTLLDRNKAAQLTQAETSELERYLFIDHLVRMAKAFALQRLADAS